MHIPASMLNGSICPVTLAVGAAGLGTAAYFAAKSAAKPSAPRFAAVTALVFALQMLNYPVQHGTSGHLVGAALAAAPPLSPQAPIGSPARTPHPGGLSFWGRPPRP